MVVQRGAEGDRRWCRSLASSWRGGCAGLDVAGLALGNIERWRIARTRIAEDQDRKERPLPCPIAGQGGSRAAQLAAGASVNCRINDHVNCWANRRGRDASKDGGQAPRRWPPVWGLQATSAWRLPSVARTNPFANPFAANSRVVAGPLGIPRLSARLLEVALLNTISSDERNQRPPVGLGVAEAGSGSAEPRVYSRVHSSRPLMEGFAHVAHVPVEPTAAGL